MASRNNVRDANAREKDSKVNSAAKTEYNNEEPKQVKYRKEHDYKLINYLGRGGTSEVYKAHNSAGDVFAIKILPLVDECDIEFAKCEMLILESISDPHVIGYKDCFIHSSYRKGNEIWLVIEYCDGGTVDCAYKALKTDFSVDLIRAILRSLINALILIHSKGIIHRDVKCGNILLKTTGEAKLSDFGASATTDGIDSLKRKTFTGTPYWYVNLFVLLYFMFFKF